MSRFLERQSRLDSEKLKTKLLFDSLFPSCSWNNLARISAQGISRFLSEEPSLSYEQWLAVVRGEPVVLRIDLPNLDKFSLKHILKGYSSSQQPQNWDSLSGRISYNSHEKLGGWAVKQEPFVLRLKDGNIVGSHHTNNLLKETRARGVSKEGKPVALIFCIETKPPAELEFDTLGMLGYKLSQEPQRS